MQSVHGQLSLLNRHEQMVVMDASYHIATDSCLPECLRERGSQADGSKIRKDREGDPGGGKRNWQAQVQGRPFRKDDRKPFRLAD